MRAAYLSRSKSLPLLSMMDVSVDCVVFGFDEKKLKVLLIEQKHNVPSVY